MSVREAGWRLGITRRAYVALEVGIAKPDSTTYERICELYGWPDARRVQPGVLSAKHPDALLGGDRRARAGPISSR